MLRPVLCYVFTWKQKKIFGKKSHEDIQFICLKLDVEWWVCMVDLLRRVLFTWTSFKGFVQAKERPISSGCRAKRCELCRSSSPGSAALQACQRVFSFPKLEVECANSRFPGYFWTVNWGRARWPGLIQSPDRANRWVRSISLSSNSAGAASPGLPYKERVGQSLERVPEKSAPLLHHPGLKKKLCFSKIQLTKKQPTKQKNQLCGCVRYQGAKLYATVKSIFFLWDPIQLWKKKQINSDTPLLLDWNINKVSSSVLDCSSVLTGQISSAQSLSDTPLFSIKRWLTRFRRLLRVAVL